LLCDVSKLAIFLLFGYFFIQKSCVPVLSCEREHYVLLLDQKAEWVIQEQRQLFAILKRLFIMLLLCGVIEVTVAALRYNILLFLSDCVRE